MMPVKEKIIGRLNNLEDTQLSAIWAFIRLLEEQSHGEVLPKSKTKKEFLPIDQDPIVGMFTGPTNLSADAEKILENDIKPQSGWTWKK